MALCVQDEAGANGRRTGWCQGMAKCEFLLDPLCSGNPEIQNIYAGQPGRRVTAVKVYIERKYRVYVRPTIGVAVRTYPPLARGLTNGK
jgi:hypothetical protein